jgi:hypothetical protein
MTSDGSIPEMTPCSLKFPYEVSYIRRRCRNTETTRFPETVDIGIRTIAEAEAPVAFVVTTGDRQRLSHPFDVRELGCAIGGERATIQVGPLCSEHGLDRPLSLQAKPPSRPKEPSAPTFPAGPIDHH